MFKTEDGSTHNVDKWDLIIAHPPCTYLSNAATRSHSLAIENPVGVMNTVYRKPDQIIEPYQFAESEDDKENYVTKRTCLWLKGLKPLQGNSLDKPNNAELFGKHPNGKARCWEEMVKGDRATVRSKTFEGIAKAMAEQWGE